MQVTKPGNKTQRFRLWVGWRKLYLCVHLLVSSFVTEGENALQNFNIYTVNATVLACIVEHTSQYCIRLSNQQRRSRQPPCQSRSHLCLPYHWSNTVRVEYWISINYLWTQWHRTSCSQKKSCTDKDKLYVNRTWPCPLFWPTFTFLPSRALHIVLVNCFLNSKFNCVCETVSHHKR